MLNVKALVERLGLSQQKLADAMKLSGGTLAQIVNHEIWPKRTEREVLVDRANHFLRSNGATDADLRTAFKTAVVTQPSVATDAPTEEEPPMLIRHQSLNPAAKRYFGLFRDPFNGDINSHDDVFASPDIRYVREAMFQTAKHGGFVAIYGESGAGKSTLRRDLLDRIAREQLDIVAIEPYVLGMEDNDIKGKTLKSTHIAEAVLRAAAPLEGPKSSPEARFDQIHRVLRDSGRAGKSHVLIIEEAHSLPILTIKHLKRFFELEDGFKRLLGVILIGQNELRLKLDERNPQVREVVQRCELIELAPLGARMEDYLKFKFDRLGKPLADVVDESGLGALRDRLTVSNGRRSGHGQDSTSLLYPLAINNLLAASMNLAAELGAPRVTADVVREV
ncbi:ExeA family protein [Lysobacter sp. CA196]|uniref:ExeA family protein n=1 Tax=Lysobacter sp. CA196 TaxID=3455606 RepID=UPI003F8D7B85